MKKYFIRVTFDTDKVVKEVFESESVISHAVSWEGNGVVSVTLDNGTVFYWPYKVVREVFVRPPKDE